MQRAAKNLLRVEERLCGLCSSSSRFVGHRRPHRTVATSSRSHQPLVVGSSINNNNNNNNNNNPRTFSRWQGRQHALHYHHHPIHIRPFSSVMPAPSQQTKSMEDVLRLTTRRVIEHPIGTMSSSLWSEAHYSILAWLDLSTAESVTIPLDLIDRLVQEATVTAISPLPEFFRIDLLNLIVNHWRKMVSENVKLRQDPNIHPQILINQLMEYHESSTSTPTLTPRLLLPNTQSFAMVIDGASSFVDGAVVADRLVDWIIDQAPNHPHMQPNVFTFSSLMRAWVKSKDTEAPHRVEDILDLMHDLHAEFPEWDVAPNQVIYATAIDAWAKWGRVDRAEQLLQDMHTAYKEVGMEWLKPNLPAFNGLLVALAKAGEMDRAQKVLEQMEALYESGELDEAPSVISYSTVLDAFAKSSKLGSARRAEKILRQMKDRGVQANSISWNIVINAYAKEKDAERAESLLREMNDEYEKGRNEVKPNMRSYGVVLSAWATMKSPQSGERAEQLLDLMLKLHESGELDEPDVVVYNSVLACWANSRIPGGGIRANQFLEKFIREGKMKPDSYSFNTVMSALVREGRLGDAESILVLMKENKFSPDATAYNTLLHAWIKSDAKHARARVEELYKRMKEDPGAKADLFTMNILLHFYSKSNNPEAAEALLREMCSPESSIKPDSISFNTALSAWTSSRRPESAERAEAILTQMVEDGERVMPNVVTFNSVLNAWVKSRPLEALNECKRLVGIMFDQVELGNVDAHPDIITYNTLINAHGVSGDDDAPQQAEIIFRELDRRFKEGDDRLKPSIHTYGSLINAWSKSTNPQAGQKAEEILRLWMDRALVGEVSDGPTRMNFTATMRAYTGSGDPLAAHRADAILFLCLREYKNGKQSCKPDNWVFVAALEALVASTVPNKMVAAQRLVELMKEYQIQPDRQKVELLKRCAA